MYVPSSALGLSQPQKGGGHTRLRGWESPNSDDLRKGLALCLLCGGDASNNLSRMHDGVELSGYKKETITPSVWELNITVCTDKKENKIFLIHKETQMGAVAKLYYI